MLVLDLLDGIIPSVACIIHDDMDLTIAKFGRFLDEKIDVVIFRYISCDGNCVATFGFDGFYYTTGLCCSLMSARIRHVLQLENINVLASKSATTTLQPSREKTRAVSAPIP